MVSPSQSLKVLVSEPLSPTVALHEPQPCRPGFGICLNKAGSCKWLASRSLLCKFASASPSCPGATATSDSSNCYKRQQYCIAKQPEKHAHDGYLVSRLAAALRG